MSTSQRLVGTEVPHDAVTTRDQAKAHGLAEYSNDVAVIMPTVSEWDQHFALLSATDGGDLELRLALDMQAVDDFYVDRVNTWSLIKSNVENEVLATWFKMVDTRGEIEMVESGAKDYNRVAVIFPVWTDGIIGEVMWTEPSWATQHIDKHQRIAVSRQLDAHDAAWRAGDVDARMETVDDRTCSVIRVVEVDGERRSLAVARSKIELANEWASPVAGRVISLDRVHRVATNSYVFAFYRGMLEFEDRRVEREIATILPLGPEGRFVGEMSYSMEIEI